MSARPPAVDVIIEAAAWDDDAEAIVRRAIGEAAAAIEKNLKGRELAVLLTDDAAVQRLNAQWRGIDKPTNVLSFPALDAPGGDATTSLGDIAIAFETTAREAREEGKPFASHLTHLSVHGFLHLMGYDHESDAEADTMENLERAILARLGVADPYLTHEIGV